ncbi:hypothetical protein BGZ60DRAFT_511010 [Tricladium varicosporioides]|nr:hypothetical protein BGZ60DRAFT_511010 [Hymenoscyphus varicosporioides]
MISTTTTEAITKSATRKEHDIYLRYFLSFISTAGIMCSVTSVLLDEIWPLAITCGILIISHPVILIAADPGQIIENLKKRKALSQQQAVEQRFNYRDGLENDEENDSLSGIDTPTTESQPSEFQTPAQTLQALLVEKTQLEFEIKEYSLLRSEALQQYQEENLAIFKAKKRGTSVKESQVRSSETWERYEEIKCLENGKQVRLERVEFNIAKLKREVTAEWKSW